LNEVISLLLNITSIVLLGKFFNVRRKTSADHQSKITKMFELVHPHETIKVLVWKLVRNAMYLLTRGAFAEEGGSRLHNDSIEGGVSLNCLVQLCENAREAQDRVRALWRELKKHKESIINGRQWPVTNDCKQGLDTTEDDQLIALLKDAEMESVGDLCQD
jgi:hypothetical protein